MTLVVHIVMKLICIKMAAKLLTSQLHLKLVLTHNETCRTSLQNFDDSLKQFDKS